MIRIPGLIFLAFFLTPFISLSQQCFNYYKDACIPQKSKYTYNQNDYSVSFLFKAGERREIPINLHEGKDYRITICSQDVFDNVVLFRIIKSDGSILYDNSQSNYSMDLEFSSQHSQEVIFELEVPDMPINGVEALNEGCVGVLIEDMISIKTGF